MRSVVINGFRMYIRCRSFVCKIMDVESFYDTGDAHKTIIVWLYKPSQYEHADINVKSRALKES